jgi:hypothetical protein
MKLRVLGSLLTPALLAGFLAIGCSTSPASDGSANAGSDFTERAVDATGKGPLAIADAEYKLPAAVDPDVIGDRATEVWAHMWRPATLNPGEKHPLIVFLHGNHGTCGTGSNPRSDDSTQYTTQGTCPDGYIVTPNHMGYSYIAERLASWGYYVVSINANRGITAGSPAPGDGGLNLARGRLVLKHLSLLSQWNTQAGTTPASLGVDLAGTIDFGEVGMSGHSRGGEGVRAALAQYNDPGSPWPAKIGTPVGFKGIFEIGPVDGQTSRTLDAKGVAWNVILPMCDGDVSDLEGMKPFDRMLAANDEPNAAPKGMFGVWGANHNYFNTEWQESDSEGCSGAGNNPLFETSGVSGSEKQQTAGLHALMGFFRGTIGKDKHPEFLKAYDPTFGVPDALDQVTHIGRAYADSASNGNTKVLENFSGAAGTSLSGGAMIATGATISFVSAPEHDRAMKAGLVKWTASGNSLEIPVGGADGSQMATLDMRISLQDQTASTATPTSFTIALVNADGTVSNGVSLKNYVELLPAGHAILETARMPLKDFVNAKLDSIKSVKITFDENASGAVYIASLRLSKPLAAEGAGQAPAGTPQTLGGNGAGGTKVHTNGNAVNGITTAPDTQDVKIELGSGDAFVVNDALPNLVIGDQTVAGAGYKDDGDTHSIVFTMSADQFAAAQDGAAMKVQYGSGTNVSHEWPVGNLDKSLNK